jgi:hypothetical protein
MVRTLSRVFLAAMAVSLTAVVSLAQQSTTSQETKSFEVLAVYGNQLTVRLPEGTGELTVADDFRFNIDGQQMSVRELKPGMKGTATITTRTTVTPVTVTEVKNGTVMQATGSSIIVRTDQGIKSFTQGDVDKRGVKIVRNGEPAQLSDFHQGDQLSATIITSRPPTVMTERQVNASLARAPAAGSAAPAAAAAPGAPAAAPAGRSASGAPPSSSNSAAPAATTGATRTLPKTASSWPLLALSGVLFLTIGIALTIMRRLVG